MKIKWTTYGFFFLMLFQNSFAQQLIENSKLSLCLNNGIEVECYESFSFNTKSNEYYYLPTKLHFTETKSGDKSLSLLIYKDKNDKIEGAIMHWLLSWGLSSVEKNELSNLLKAKIGEEAKLMGAVLMVKSESKPDFEILGSNKLSPLLSLNTVNRGKAPNIANASMAIAFSFDKDEASTLENVFHDKKEQRTTNIVMRFTASFKKTNGQFYKKNIELKQNLQTLISH